MRRPVWVRRIAFVAGDVVLLAAALIVAFLLRFEGELPPEYHARLALFILLSVIVNIPVFHAFGLYRISLRHASFYEVMDVFKAVSVASLLHATLLLILLRETTVGLGVPRAVPVINYFLTLLAIGGFRSIKRIWSGLIPRKAGTGRRLLIVGAGAAGSMLLKELQSNPAVDSQVVGLIDDDPAKAVLTLHGVAVRGERDKIPAVVASDAVDEIVIAMPSVPAKILSEIVTICKRTHTAVKILPAIYTSLGAEIKVAQVRDVQIEDLLSRRPVRIDVATLRAVIRGESVLVTGAGGSIGSELCRQIALLEPQRLVLLGNNENDIFEIERELASSSAQFEIVSVIADVRHAVKIEHVFRTFKPTLVFHAAAHKHVPLMEQNPDEAVSNNIVGTKIMAEACDRWGVRRMVFISTDKAVNPTSVMGASKRFAELLIQSWVPASGTRFIIVRFGNVLGSAGSILPIFRKQLAAGGPLTVTDTEMTRYFMTIPEAVHLIMQASVSALGGEVFVLDMGDPIRILDLAENLVRMSGLEPYRDIDIVFTGPRPGEKRHEETFFASEAVERTALDRILVARSPGFPDRSRLELDLVELVRAASVVDADGIRNKLLAAVASFG